MNCENRQSAELHQRNTQTTMKTVEEALQLVGKYIDPITQTEKLPLDQALGRVLSENIHSPINMPPFRQSAMDGYALRVGQGRSYELIGEIQAGSGKLFSLQPNQAVRIFTGAAVPDDADALVMQEKVEKVGEGITVLNEPKPQENIRPQGEQMLKGALALPEGTVLSPAAIGFLATLGIAEAAVYQMPSIAIVITGSELVEAGKALAHGQIYESNAIMLQQTLWAKGYTKTHIVRVPDDYEATVTGLQKVISNHDVVLVSGGISVGDYDFVGKALKALGVEEVFYKVRQKPGKPLFFGVKGEVSVFALPGNPASALSCSHAYVIPALQRLSRRGGFAWASSQKQIKTAYEAKGDWAQFLKARVTGSQVEILSGQSSAMLHTFATANGLVYLPLHQLLVQAGDWVEVLEL